jgi:hypothetical protein
MPLQSSRNCHGPAWPDAGWRTGVTECAENMRLLHRDCPNGTHRVHIHRLSMGIREESSREPFGFLSGSAGSNSGDRFRFSDTKSRAILIVTNRASVYSGTSTNRQGMYIAVALSDTSQPTKRGSGVKQIDMPLQVSVRWNEEGGLAQEKEQMKLACAVVRSSLHRGFDSHPVRWK